MAARPWAAVRTWSWRRRCAVGTALVVVLLGWLAVRAVQIQGHLSEARATLTGLSGLSNSLGGGPAVDQSVRTAMVEADGARAASDDPVWRLAAAVPVAGRGFAMARDLAHITAALLHATVPQVLDAEGLLAGHRLVDQGQVNLTLLTLIRSPLEQASVGTADARRRAARVSTRFVPGFLSRQKDVLLHGIDTVSGGLDSAVTTLRLAPPMLGRDGPRRYFVAVMNEAESRASGGFIGAYAILRVADGRITKERVGTDVDFRNSPSPVVELGAEFARNYDGFYARRHWSALGVSPHWPYTSRVLAGLLAAQGGGPVDGVIGLDPLSMADILGATGPVTFGGRILDAGNVASFVLRDEYFEFHDHDIERKRILADLAGAIFQHVVDGAAPPAALARALAHAATTGHLLLFSAHPQEEAVLHGMRIAGELTNQPGAFLAVATQNAAGNKMDSYLRRGVEYVRPRAGQGRLVLTLTNLVPKNAPKVILQRLDAPTTPQVYGETRVLVTVYCSVHALVTEMSVNGLPAPFEPGTENGHGTARLLVAVRPGHPTVLVASMTDPGGALYYRPQPLASPEVLRLHVPTRSH